MCIARYAPVRSPHKAGGYYSSPGMESLEREASRKYVYEHENTEHRASPKYYQRSGYYPTSSQQQQYRYSNVEFAPPVRKGAQLAYQADYTKGARRKQKQSEGDEQLNQRISALKDCIKEIESKQEQLLDRIDTKINKHYEPEPVQRQSQASKFDEVYQKSVDKSQQIRSKYLNDAAKHDYSIKQTPEKPKFSRINQDLDDSSLQRDITSHVHESKEQPSSISTKNHIENPETELQYHPRSKFLR